jgi:hypothetical protein
MFDWLWMCCGHEEGDEKDNGRESRL